MRNQRQMLVSGFRGSDRVKKRDVSFQVQLVDAVRYQA